MLIVVFLSFYSMEIKMKAVLIFLILFTYGILLIKFMPYKGKKHSYIDIVSTVICAVSVNLGIFIY